MTTGQELDAVVRWVDAEVSIDPSCQVVVPIDSRTGQPVRAGIWPALGKKHHRLALVTNSHRAAAVAIRNDLRIPVADFSRGWSFELILDYQARCQPGREVRVAQALWQGPSPQDRLESLLEEWVLGRLEGRVAEFIGDFDRAAEELAGEIRDLAAEQTGLTLAARVQLEDNGRRGPLRIGPVAFAVCVRDCDDELQLRLEGDLAIVPGKERIAYLQREREKSLGEEIQREAREHLATGVTLHQFHVELSGHVQQELWRRLDAFLEAYGRRVVRLSLRGESLPGLEKMEKPKCFEHQFSYRLCDYPKPVEVKTELLLELVDLGAYARAQVRDLKDWANSEVQEAVTLSLFRVTYTELCLHYEEKKAEVERRMKERAAAIGYDLKQLITITDLQFDVLRRPFAVTFEDEFATKLAKFRVGLEVNASVVVPHPSEIASLLDRSMDVKEQIRDTLLDRLRQEFHDVEPQSFYMEFDRALEGRIPVRERLEAVIRTTLAEEFHAQALSLSCKQLDSELSRRLDRLMATLHTFEVKVVASRGGPPVLFEGSFRVLGADPEGWIEFRTSSPEPEALRDCAARHLGYLLADKTLGELIQTPNAVLKGTVNLWVQSRLRKQFGLTVEVMDWMRRPLPGELHAAAVRDGLVKTTLDEVEEGIGLSREMRKTSREMAQEAADSRLQELRDLPKRIVRARADGDLDLERQLRERIAELKEEQKVALEELKEDPSGIILPRLAAARGLLVEEADKGVPRSRGALPEPEPAVRDASPSRGTEAETQPDAPAAEAPNEG
jgi:hypothetical protein